MSGLNHHQAGDILITGRCATQNNSVQRRTVLCILAPRAVEGFGKWRWRKPLLGVTKPVCRTSGPMAMLLNAKGRCLQLATGSGKSVLMQNILLGIAATNTPRQANILLIDPKQGVDYFQFEDLPHLGGGVIVDDQQAIQRLETLVQ